MTSQSIINCKHRCATHSTQLFPNLPSSILIDHFNQYQNVSKKNATSSSYIATTILHPRYNVLFSSSIAFTMSSQLFIILALSIPISLTSALPTVSSAKRPYYFRRCSITPSLVCVLRPTTGNRVSGDITFTSVSNPFVRFWDWHSRRCHVHVTATVRNLTPGPHGIHIHAYGDARSTNASSTGGHFLNRQFRPVRHGLPFNSQRHWGDFVNIIAASNGVARLNFMDRSLSSVALSVAVWSFTLVKTRVVPSSRPGQPDHARRAAWSGLLTQGSKFSGKEMRGAMDQFR